MPNGTSEAEYILTDLNARIRTLEGKYSLLVNLHMYYLYQKNGLVN